eukprot:c26493_g1_i1 orf=1-213(+)
MYKAILVSAHKDFSRPFICGKYLSCTKLFLSLPIRVFQVPRMGSYKSQPFFDQSCIGVVKIFSYISLCVQ